MFARCKILKVIRITAIFLLIQTITWVILMGMTTAPIESGWESQDYVCWAAEKGAAYVINYVNVSLLTVVAVVLFALLYRYLKDLASGLALAGLILVPVYGVMNLVCYTMQISLVGYLNGLAYAILGVPSILYGVLLYRKLKKWSGALLTVNGVLCIFGIIGYSAGSDLLSAGTILGGIAFLIALAALVIEFRPGSTSSPA